MVSKLNDDKRKWKKRLFVFTLFAPSLIILLVVVAYPLIRSLILSFRDYNLLTPMSNPFVGLDNYRQIFNDQIFWVAFKNTMIFNLGAVIGGFLIGFILALILNSEIKFRKLFRSLFMTSWVVPYVIIGFLFLFMFNSKIGIVNYTLKRLNIINDFLHWFSRGQLAMTTVVLATIWNQFPFHMVTFLAGLQTIPENLKEAARIDGASSWQIFRYITLPWMRNIIMISTTLMMITNFNNFAIIWTITEGGPIRSTTTFVIYVFQKAFVEFNFGYASAIGIIWLLFLVGFAWFYIKLMNKEVV